jgi:hypothetical protein
MMPVLLDFPFLIAPSVYLQELSPFNSDKISAVLSLFIEHFNIATSYEITIALRLFSNFLHGSHIYELLGKDIQIIRPFHCVCM